MSDKITDEISTDLKRVVRLLALLVTEGKSPGEQTAKLDKAGFRPIEISEMLGIPANVVRARLSNIRKSADKQAKTAKGVESA
jgi:hypothetical protein